MVSRSLVLGYHGCDLATVEKIVTRREQQKPSINEYDWLGSGFYFWEDSYDRALRWAKAEAGKPSGKIKTPGVLGAIIDLGQPLYENAGLRSHDHIQICVRNSKQMVGYFIPQIRRS